MKAGPPPHQTCQLHHLLLGLGLTGCYSYCGKFNLKFYMPYIKQYHRSFIGLAMGIAENIEKMRIFLISFHFIKKNSFYLYIAFK